MKCETRLIITSPKAGPGGPSLTTVFFILEGQLMFSKNTDRT